MTVSDKDQPVGEVLFSKREMRRRRRGFDLDAAPFIRRNFQQVSQNIKRAFGRFQQSAR